MRGARSLLVLSAVFALVVGYVYFVESKRDPSETETKETVFDIEGSDIDELTLTSSGGQTTSLVKRDVGWDVTAPKQIKADVTEAAGLVNSLASLEIQRVVETEPSDLSTYGLDEPRVTVAFKTEPDQEPVRLLIGEKTATGGDLYAKRETDPRVFLISGYLENTFDRSTFDLQDKTILDVETQSVDTLEIRTADVSLDLSRQEGDWTLVQPIQARADYGTVQGLLGRLTTSQMKGVAEENPEDLSPFGLDTPSATVVIGTGSARATLDLGSVAEEGSVYARDRSRPTVFTVDATLADELLKTPADYRSKDLFQFRPFDATRFEMAREGGTMVFEKVTEGEGEERQTVWRQTAPATRDFELSDMETALAGMANLRILYFAEPGVDTGLDAPETTVSVRFGEAQSERVFFGRHEQDVYASMEGEPGTARIDTKDYTVALKSLDDLLAGSTSETAAEDPDAAPPPQS